MSKKLIALLLASLMAITVFTACEPKDDNGDETTVEETTVAEGEAEDTTAAG